MASRTDRAKLVGKWRNLAKRAEKVEAACDPESGDRSTNGVNAFFICNEVKLVLGDVGCKQLDRILPESTPDLWALEGRCMPVRVLMLCFMAAMVEAGDA